MARTTASNYTNPGFQYATADPDQFDRTDVAGLGQSVNVHDHSSGNGLAVVRIANNAVSTAAIADGAVTSAKIADGTIVGADIAAATVAQANLANLSVGTAQLIDTAVTTAKIADAQITQAKLTTGSVGTGQLVDGSATTAKLADSSVTSAKIVDGTIQPSDLALGAVTSLFGIYQGVPTFSTTTTGVYVDTPIAVSGTYDGLSGAFVLVTATFTLAHSASGGVIYVQFSRNGAGTGALAVHVNAVINETKSYSVTWYEVPPTGTNTWTLQIFNSVAGTASMSGSVNATMRVLEIRR